MSLMRCERCTSVVDTDEDLEGTWTDFGYICEACCEREDADERPVTP